MKKIVVLLCLIFTVVTISLSQVSSLNYLLNHNCETNLYEVKIKILEGSATETGDRVQFNSQISMVIPTGLDFEIVERLNPLQNNQNYNGTEPCEWSLFTPVISPPEQPENDFYSISPSLSPASFYNNLEAGDEVILFICKIGTDTEFNPNIRFYNNDVDPQIQSAGSDFNNGFAIGTIFQIYQGNEYKSCVSSVVNTDTEISVYPNPFDSQLVIECETIPTMISLSNITGEVVYQDLKPSKRQYYLSTESLLSGVYFLKYADNTGEKTKKLVKK